MRIFTIIEGKFDAIALPIIGGVVAKIALPLMSEKNFNVTHIPINTEI